MSLKRFLNQDKPVIKLQETCTVMEAIDRMMERKTGAVLVVADDAGVKGIFTERDVMTKVVAAGRDPAQTSLCEVMTTDVVVLAASSRLDHAINIMGKNGIRHLPIEDKEHNLLGMISLRHLLHEKIEMMLEELDILESYDKNDAPGG